MKTSGAGRDWLRSRRGPQPGGGVRGEQAVDEGGAGKAAVALLVNQIENVAVYPEELLFEPELVVRGSTGRPAAELS